MLQRLISQVVRGGTASRGRRPATRGPGRRRPPAGGTAGGIGARLGPMVQRYLRTRR